MLHVQVFTDALLETCTKEYLTTQLADKGVLNDTSIVARVRQVREVKKTVRDPESGHGVRAAK